MSRNLHGRVPLVLVLVGTDHHPFDRVVRWADAWARTQAGAVRVVVQHGTAAAPEVAEGHRIFSHDRLVELVRAADVVVTHGGPATICEVRAAGTTPLVVPRDPARGEHVDGHQQRFARRVAADGLVVLCETEAALVGALDRAMSGTAWLAVSTVEERARVARAVDAVGAVVQELTGMSHRQSRQRSWLLRLPAPRPAREAVASPGLPGTLTQETPPGVV